MDQAAVGRDDRRRVELLGERGDLCVRGAPVHRQQRKPRARHASSTAKASGTLPTADRIKRSGSMCRRIAAYAERRSARSAILAADSAA